MSKIIVQNELNDGALNDRLTQTFAGMNEATRGLIGRDFFGNVGQTILCIIVRVCDLINVL